MGVVICTLEVDTSIGEDDREVSFFCTRYSDCAGSTVHYNSDRRRDGGVDISEKVKAVGHTDDGSTICQAALVVNFSHVWAGGVAYKVAFRE